MTPRYVWPTSLFIVALGFISILRGQSADETRSLVLQKWSGALNVPDPVACAVDPQGRVYVSSTSRRRVADLEIRQFPDWMAGDLALTSVAEKSAFLKKMLPLGGRTTPFGDLKDQNGDGFVDWKDLTVATERIYQLRDTDGDGTADKITVFAEGFNSEVTGIAAGVLYHDGWVYMTLAPDLWRFKDTDDDGVADIREILVHGFGLHIGYGGHDMHGLTVGTDGRIYWSIGDKAVNVTSREGRHFFFPNEGSILRIEPDGSDFEVYAHGVRNTQEPAFDEFGDLIAVDNDADFEGERERFVYLPEGSDSGWRQNYQYMGPHNPWLDDGLWKPAFPGQPVYFLPPISNYSDGPGGFKRDPGTALGDDMRGVFLLNEFPSGKMRGFRAEHDGATFKMVDESVRHEGIMGVGMSWHPDGSLMMVDWLSGWAIKGAGAIWRVDVADDRRTPSRRETQQLLGNGFTAKRIDELGTLLSHADQRVRLGAQFELVKRKQTDVFLSVAKNEKAPLLARLHAIWGYGQLMRRGDAAIDPSLGLLKDANSEIRTQAVRILGDATVTKPPAGALATMLADLSPRVRLQAAIAVGKLHEHIAVAPLLTMAEKDFESPVLRHAVIGGLSGCATPEELAELRRSPSTSIRLVSVVALRRQSSPLIADFLNDSDELVVGEAARGIHDDFSIPAALPRLAAILDHAPSSSSITRRSINANYRLGTPETAARLVKFALESSHEPALRGEALTCLRLWPKPGTIDRVDGHSRQIETAPIEHVLTPNLDSLLALTEPELKTTAIEIMIAHSLPASSVQINSIVRDIQAPADLRAQALRLMASKGGPNPIFSSALDMALDDESPPALHRTALELLLPLNPARLIEAAQLVLSTRSVAEKQHALALLAATATPAADDVLARYAEQLLAGTCPPELQLDVIEALRTRSSAIKKFAESLKSYDATSEGTAHRELLNGGTPESGKTIVQTNLASSCLSCHSVSSKGGSEVGPNLSTVGSRRDAAYLLESLVAPSAKIAPGYGVVSVTLKDGSDVAGTLAQETPDAITIRLFDGNRRTMARSDVATQTAAISVMPPMYGVLKPREIRDVVAFLSSLTATPKKAPAPHTEE